MPVYSFFEKIKYRLKAKNLHGVHSPFVYDFVEQILNAGFRSKETTFNWPQTGFTLSDQQKKIINELIAYYKIDELALVPSEQIIEAEQARSKLFISNGAFDPRYAAHELNIVAVPDIYKSKENTLNWNKLRERSEVRLSLDIYEMGLLFFRNDFKVKQSFVLKPKHRNEN